MTFYLEMLIGAIVINAIHVMVTGEQFMITLPQAFTMFPLQKMFLTMTLVTITIVMLSGCSSTVTPGNEWYMSAIKPQGEKSYDPPGGDWIFLPNEPNSAKGLFRRQGWNWNGDGSAPQY